jgi:uncharacterized protein YfbU (UPF0304 family)
MSPSERTELLRAELTAQIKKLEAEKARMQKLYLLAMIDREGRVLAFEKSAANAEKAMKAAWDKYRSVMEQACHRYGLDPKKSAYDPDTGILAQME